MSTVQEYLQSNGDYRFIDGKNFEFTETPSNSNHKFTSVQKWEQLINTSMYVLIYNVKTDKYYTMPLGTIGYKPYFNESKELV